MATRKTTKKTAGKKASGASSARRRVGASASMIPYGDPIRDAMARGEVQEMRKVAASARKWIAEVSKALESLEKAIAKNSGK